MTLKTDYATNEISGGKPKNISEKDYQAFLELMDAMNSSEDEEESEGEEEKQNNEEGSSHDKVKVSEDEGIGKKRRVHFSANEGGSRATTADGKFKTNSSNGNERKSKTILLNRDERSPICQQEVERMNKAEPSKSVLPTSKETLRDFVAERCAFPVKEMASPHSMGRNQRKQQRKTNKISAWKAARMGLAKNEEEEEDFS